MSQASFPSTRLRRNRATAYRRDLVAETQLHASDLIYPLFVQEGAGKAEIKTLPGIKRYGINELLEEVQKAYAAGIRGIALFPHTLDSKKDATGKEAENPGNLVCRAIRGVKHACPELVVFADVALDPYTTHGHDGVLDKKGEVDNDATVKALCKQAIVLAKAGADYVAPSDMMDGRVGAIRTALDDAGHINTGILSYAVKYASAFYGPFREAVGSAKSLGTQGKNSYQMDYRNTREALREAELDVAEGADILMVKPAMPYLDVIESVKKTFSVPLFAYQVSGEYAMLKLAIKNGILPESAMYESLMGIKRAGADAIFTYAAQEVAAYIAAEK